MTIIKTKDTYPALELILTDGATGKAIDLTGAVKVDVILKTGATVIESTAEVVEPSGGKVTVPLEAITTEAVTYEVEAKITWDGGVQSVPNEGAATVTIEQSL